MNNQGHGEADRYLPAAELDGVGKGSERDRLQVPAHQRTDLAPRCQGLLSPDLVEKQGNIVGILHPIEETDQRLAFDQPGGTDPHRGEHFAQLLGSPGLELEQSLKLAPVIVGAHRVGDRAADQVQARQPGEGRGMGSPPGGMEPMKGRNAVLG